MTSYDALGLWGAGGHYYTVMIVAYAAGYSAQEAQELAFHAQMSDQIEEYDAINGASISWWRYGCSAGAFRAVQGYGHALLGMRAGPVRSAFSEAIGSLLMDLPQEGVWVHAFGDLYAHSYVQNGVDMLYSPGVGHTVDWHTPDQIGEHYDQYSKYVRALFDVLKQHKKGTVRDGIISKLLDKTRSLGDLCKTEQTTCFEGQMITVVDYDMDIEAGELRTFAESAEVFGKAMPSYAPERLPSDLRSVSYKTFLSSMKRTYRTVSPIDPGAHLRERRYMERHLQCYMQEWGRWDE